MDLYTRVSFGHAQSLTNAYSSSFGLSSRLFGKRIRPHIYNIYGLVRIADEIVDTYREHDARMILDELEQETYQAVKRQYSVNPIVHAFAHTAQKYGISKELIAPFFASMRMDLKPARYTPQLYDTYIYGSAEVVGLMCLKVFCEGDTSLYKKLDAGASKLGAAYQKVNFLRDLAQDSNVLKRWYFPGTSHESFSDDDKGRIVQEIEADFAAAHIALLRLPRTSRVAVMTSYKYYQTVLGKLRRAPVAEIRTRRLRISQLTKILLLVYTIGRYGWRR